THALKPFPGHVYKAGCLQLIRCETFERDRHLVEPSQMLCWIFQFGWDLVIQVTLNFRVFCQPVIERRHRHFHVVRFCKHYDQMLRSWRDFEFTHAQYVRTEQSFHLARIRWSECFQVHQEEHTVTSLYERRKLDDLILIPECPSWAYCAGEKFQAAERHAESSEVTVLPQAGRVDH